MEIGQGRETESQKDSQETRLACVQREWKIVFRKTLSFRIDNSIKGEVHAGILI